MKRRRSVDTDASAPKRAKTTHTSRTLRDNYAFVHITCVLANVTSAAQPELVPFNAMHAVCSVIQNTTHRVREYREACRNCDTIPSISVVQCGKQAGTALRCVKALRRLQEVFPFEHNESTLLSPSWLDITSDGDVPCANETLVIRELDMQFASAMATASILRDTVGRVVNPPSFALNICHRNIRRPAVCNTLEGNATRDLWAYVSCYLIASAERLDTRTPRFGSSDELPVWKQFEKDRHKPRTKPAPAPVDVVCIGDLRGCDPCNNWPMTPRKREQTAPDYRYAGMSEPTRKASAALLSRVPDLLMVMLSAGDLLKWPTDGGPCAADDTVVVDTVIAWIHAEVLGTDQEQPLAPLSDNATPSFDAFSRIGRISMRHAILCMVMGGSPHVVCEDVLRLLYSLCMLAQNMYENVLVWKASNLLLVWLRSIPGLFCECDSLSGSQSDDDDDAEGRGLGRIWHDIPECMLSAIYDIVFDPVVVPTSIIAMRIIDGIRLRNPPQCVPSEPSTKPQDANETLVEAAVARVQPDRRLRTIRTDCISASEQRLSAGEKSWFDFKREYALYANALSCVLRRSQFLTSVVDTNTSGYSQIDCIKSLENARHAWYIRTAVVAAVLCAYEILGCKLASNCAVVLSLDTLVTASKLAARSITLSVANELSATNDYNVCPEFAELIGDARSSTARSSRPSFVASLPLLRS